VSLKIFKVQLRLFLFKQLPTIPLRKRKKQKTSGIGEIAECLIFCVQLPGTWLIAAAGLVRIVQPGQLTGGENPKLSLHLFPFRICSMVSQKLLLMIETWQCSVHIVQYHIWAMIPWKLRRRRDTRHTDLVETSKAERACYDMKETLPSLGFCLSTQQFLRAFCEVSLTKAKATHTAGEKLIKLSTVKIAQTLLGWTRPQQERRHSKWHFQSVYRSNPKMPMEKKSSNWQVNEPISNIREICER